MHIKNVFGIVCAYLTSLACYTVTLLVQNNNIKMHNILRTFLCCYTSDNNDRHNLKRLEFAILIFAYENFDLDCLTFY